MIHHGPNFLASRDALLRVISNVSMSFSVASKRVGHAGLFTCCSGCFIVSPHEDLIFPVSDWLSSRLNLPQVANWRATFEQSSSASPTAELGQDVLAIQIWNTMGCTCNSLGAIQ